MKSCVMWVSRVLVVSVLLLCVFVNLACAEMDTRPIVVFRVDDCRTTWLVPYQGLGGVSALAYCSQNKIPITWAVITSLADTGAQLSWATLEDYLNTSGGEVASHSYTHSSMPDIQSYIDELTVSKQALIAHLPDYFHGTFLQPGGWEGIAYMDSFDKLYNPIGLAIQTKYERSMAYLGSAWRVGNVYYRYGMTNNYSIDYVPTQSIADMLATMDVVAATPGLVFVVTGHGVSEVGSSTGYTISSDVLKAFVDKLVALRDAGEVRLMSISDAYDTAFPTDINHIVDPGFELSVSDANNTIMPSGGVDNSKYSIPIPGKYTERDSLLSPGRYRVSWFQKEEAPSVGSKYLSLAMYNYSSSKSIYPVSFERYANTTKGLWEERSALAIIGESLPNSQLKFYPDVGASYGIDNLSVVSEPLDTQSSPAGSVGAAYAQSCVVSWISPKNADVVQIVLRYGARSHPLKPTSGAALGAVAAVAQTRQSIESPVNWSANPKIYISVFGVRADGSFTGPDLVYLAAPIAPTLQIRTPSNPPTYSTALPTVVLTGTVNHTNDITSITWANDKGGAGACHGVDYWSTDAIALAEGNNVITISVTDSAGSMASASLIVTYKQSLKIMITSPTALPKYSSTLPYVRLAGTAPSTVNSLTWKTGSGAAGKCSGKAKWSIAKVRLVPGDNTITVSATDKFGRTGSAIITVNYSNTTPPVVKFSSPSSNNTFTTKKTSVAIAGSAKTSSSLSSINWTNVATGATGSCAVASIWRVASVVLKRGTNAITVTAKDIFGNVGSAQLTVIQKETIAPKVIIVSPPPKTVYKTTSASIDISGTSSDNDAVAGLSWSNLRGGKGDCVGTTSWRAHAIPLAKGKNSITVTVIDASGNKAYAVITVFRS